MTASRAAAGSCEGESSRVRVLSKSVEASAASRGAAQRLTCGPMLSTVQVAVRCVRRPQGAPSGVWTGHMKPQDSGKSLRTAVKQRGAQRHSAIPSRAEQ